MSLETAAQHGGMEAGQGNATAFPLQYGAMVRATFSWDIPCKRNAISSFLGGDCQRSCREQSALGTELHKGLGQGPCKKLL